MITVQQWDWLPNNMTFQPIMGVHEPVFGKQPHGFISPFWAFDMTLPPVTEEVRREIDVFRTRAGGSSIVEVYDIRIPFPAHYSNVDPKIASQIVPKLIVKAMDKSAETITVSGTVGDVIITGDPISFVYDNVRYYFKAESTITLTGGDDILSVMLRPRKTVASMSVIADRVKPRCRFVINVNAMGGRTGSHGLTNYQINGVEFYGAVT